MFRMYSAWLGQVTQPGETKNDARRRVWDEASRQWKADSHLREADRATACVLRLIAGSFMRISVQSCRIGVYWCHVVSAGHARTSIGGK